MSMVRQPPEPQPDFYTIEEWLWTPAEGQHLVIRPGGVFTVVNSADEVV